MWTGICIDINLCLQVYAHLHVSFINDDIYYQGPWNVWLEDDLVDKQLVSAAEDYL